MTVSASRNLYTPEILPLIAGGQIPAYNVFPYAAVNRDLEVLLANPSSDFANNVESAANGTLTGIVYDGDTQSLVYDMMSAGRQLEANQEWKHKQRMSEKTTEADGTSQKEIKASADIELTTCSEEKAANDNHRDKTKPALSMFSLSAESADSVKAIGKLLGQIIESEFTISLPPAKLHAVTPAELPPSIMVMSKSTPPAFNLH